MVSIFSIYTRKRSVSLIVSSHDQDCPLYTRRVPRTHVVEEYISALYLSKVKEVPHLPKVSKYLPGILYPAIYVNLKAASLMDECVSFWLLSEGQQPAICFSL